MCIQFDVVPSIQSSNSVRELVRISRNCSECANYCKSFAMAEWRATSVGFLPPASSMFTSALSNFVSFSSRKGRTVMLLPVVPAFTSAWCSISNFIISICPSTSVQLLCLQILPTAAFHFLLQDWLHGFPQTVYCYFWACPFLVFLFYTRLLMSAFERTLK